MNATPPEERWTRHAAAPTWRGIGNGGSGVATNGELGTLDLPGVLILGDHLGYPRNIGHGVTSYFLNTLPALAERGIALHVCFLREPHAAAAGLHAHGIVPSFLSASKWDPTVALRVATMIRTNNIRIVHAAGMKATLVARIAGRLTGAQIIVHAHDMLRPPPALRVAHELLARAHDCGIGVSEAARALVISGYRVPRARTRVIHNGIDLERITNVAADAAGRLRDELAIPASGALILMIARMHPIKGHRVMLRIMARVVERHPDAVLVLAGDGPERAACERLAETLGIAGAVRFLGGRSDIPDLLAACDLVVVPSQSEGLSLAAIEAFAAGKPVVGFATGGLRDVIDDGENGLLADEGDEAQFADRVCALLASPERIARLGTAARQKARQFALEHHVRELIGFYRAAVAYPHTTVIAATAPCPSN